MTRARIAEFNLLAVIGQLLLASSGNCAFANVENTIAEDADDLNIITRETWKAQPPVKPPTPLAITPAPYAIISHTALEPCTSPDDCSQKCRMIQTLHIEGNGFNDIGYNFLVGGDGNVYAGRGWDVEGAHTFNYNKKSIGISFIGLFTSATPSEQQLQAAQELLAFGVANGKLAEDYKLLGHRQVSETQSPGDVLYGIIQTWPHWAAEP